MSSDSFPSTNQLRALELAQSSKSLILCVSLDEFFLELLAMMVAKSMQKNSTFTSLGPQVIVCCPDAAGPKVTDMINLTGAPGCCKYLAKEDVVLTKPVLDRKFKCVVGPPSRVKKLHKSKAIESTAVVCLCYIDCEILLKEQYSAMVYLNQAMAMSLHHVLYTFNTLKDKEYQQVLEICHGVVPAYFVLTPDVYTFSKVSLYSYLLHSSEKKEDLILEMLSRGCCSAAKILVVYAKEQDEVAISKALSNAKVLFYSFSGRLDQSQLTTLAHVLDNSGGATKTSPTVILVDDTVLLNIDWRAAECFICATPVSERETFQRGLGLCQIEVNKLNSLDRPDAKDSKLRKALFLCSNEKELNQFNGHAMECKAKVEIVPNPFVFVSQTSKFDANQSKMSFFDSELLKQLMEEVDGPERQTKPALSKKEPEKDKVDKKETKLGQLLKVTGGRDGEKANIEKDRDKDKDRYLHPDSLKLERIHAKVTKQIKIQSWPSGKVAITPQPANLSTLKDLAADMDGAIPQSVKRTRVDNWRFEVATNGVACITDSSSQEFTTSRSSFRDSVPTLKLPINNNSPAPKFKSTSPSDDEFAEARDNESSNNNESGSDFTG